MITSYENSLLSSLDQNISALNLRMEAVKAFNLSYSQGKLGQLWAKVSRKDNHLQSLDSQPLSNHRPTSRIVSIPIRQIKGSLGRSDDFDLSFHPLNERSRSRWVSILTAMRMNIPIPPVELVQVGESYYVRDGHHRISVARALEQESIDARIVN